MIFFRLSLEEVLNVYRNVRHSTEILGASRIVNSEIRFQIQWVDYTSIVIILIDIFIGKSIFKWYFVQE